MFEEQKTWPLYQMIQRRSLAPLWEQFNAQNRGRILPNLNQGLVSFALGATGSGGMNLPKTRIVQPNNMRYNLSPNIGTMLKGYKNMNRNVVDPEFYYKNNVGYFNNNNLANRRSLAKSYLSKFKK